MISLKPAPQMESVRYKARAGQPPEGNFFQAGKMGFSKYDEIR